jgi:signal transduction histidine kinase/ActR/RegA family two-component response regulator
VQHFQSFVVSFSLALQDSKKGATAINTTVSELERLPDLDEYIKKESALELTRRSLVGAPVYTVISLIMLAGTPMALDYGSWAISEVILLILLGVIRFWFALSFERRYDQVGEKAVSQFSILTALQSLTLGILSAMVIWQYWAAKEVVLTIVLSAGCIAAGTSALSVRRSAQLIFLACVLVPLGFAVYLVGGLAAAMLITGFLSLMAFLVQDGGQAKRAYFKHLEVHYSDKILRRRSALELQAKKELIKEIGHGIRTPVNSIIGMTALLLDEKLGTRAREIADTIQKSSNVLWGLISDLPGSVKTMHDASEVQLGAINLRQCIENTKDLYRQEAADKGLEFTTRIEDIPEDVISYDQGQLEQVLANLMVNAVQYTDKGSITLSTSCNNLHDGTVLIEFSVADTGPGIPVEYRESVFRPFSNKGVKSSGKFGDDGLGLPLCKGLVELMGGDIWIEDNDDRGTIVKFTIRAVLDPSDNTWEAAGETSSKPGEADLRHFLGEPSNVSQLHPHSILVVDDDEIHRQIVCTQLQKMGYAADEAADGEQAIAAVMQGAYDLVFMDVRMPIMSGIESTRWIRDRFNGDDLRIIALTGDASIETREHCMRAGMDNFVTKPVKVKDIEAILCHSRHDQNKPVSHINGEMVH